MILFFKKQKLRVVQFLIPIHTVHVAPVYSDCFFSFFFSFFFFQTSTVDMLDYLFDFGKDSHAVVRTAVRPLHRLTQSISVAGLCFLSAGTSQEFTTV